jgi:hypothetical protein
MFCNYSELEISICTQQDQEFCNKWSTLTLNVNKYESILDDLLMNIK